MKELFKKLGARVTQVEVEYSRKMADGNYGSVGGMFRVTAEVEQGKNPDETIDGLFAWIKEAAVRNMKPSFGEVLKENVAQPTQLHVPPEKEEGREFGKLMDEAEQFYDGEQPEGTMITVSRIYIHQGKKARCAFIHDTADYEDKGAVAFKDDLASVDLNIDALTAGRSYTADELGISRAVIVGEGKDAKVSELIK